MGWNVRGEGARVFAQMVRANRRRLGLTQEELAANAGLNVRSVRKIEAGQVGSPRPATVRLLADAFGLTGADRERFCQVSAGETTDQPIKIGVDEPSPAPSCMLPPELPDFVGRESETKVVLDQLTNEQVPSVVRVVVVSGLSGIGKTSLVVRLTHRLRPQSPAGQLYVDLHGDRAPLEPAEALGQLLRALGVQGSAVPDSLDERAARFRATLAERQCLVVLDNASSAAQVRPLLPGTAAMVLVTSRNALVDLDGAYHLRLDPLPQNKAVELVTRIVGPERVAGEPEAADDIARYCGGIPLAVRIASTNLLSQPYRTLRAMAAELADPAGRLDQLERTDRSMRKVLDSAHAYLPESAKLLLRRLSAMTQGTSPLWLAGVLVDDRRTGAVALRALSEASLVDFEGPDAAGQHRVRLHELVRTFGRERARAEDTPQEQYRVLRSVLGSWLTLAEEADMLLSGYLDAPCTRIGRSLPRSPKRTDVHRSDPHSWFSAEQESLVALIATAASTPELGAYAWTLAWNCEYYLRQEARYDTATAVCRQGLTTAEHSRDWEGVAAMRLCLSTCHMLRGEPAIALEHITRAQAAGDRASNEWLLAAVWGATEQILRTTPGDRDGHAEMAALQRAIKHFEAAGDIRSAGAKLSALGALAAERDEPTAGSILTRAVQTLRAAGTRRGLAIGLYRLATWHSLTGDYAAARGLCLESLTLAQEESDLVGEICAHSELALLLAGAGELAEAASHIADALTRAHEADSPLYMAYARYANGRLQLIRGELELARNEIEAAVDSLQVRPAWHVPALADLAEIHERAGDQDAARATLHRALRVATRGGAIARSRLVRQRLAQLPSVHPSLAERNLLPPDDQERR
jgi:transcriptional regulator with XRE-family HTH domain/tetratricopeptide (TPR) repeat protein